MNIDPKDAKRGLYKKFTVDRVDGSSAFGQKHYGCDYFVLDLTHDPHAAAALLAYAESCQQDYPQLAADLRARAASPGLRKPQLFGAPDVIVPPPVVLTPPSADATAGEALTRLRDAIAARDAKGPFLGPYGFEDDEMDDTTRAVLDAAYALAARHDGGAA